MKTRKAPSAPVDSTSIAWCRFVSAACLDVDWTQLAADTIRDPRIAAVVVKGLQSLGHYIEGEIERAEATASGPPPSMKAPPIAESESEAAYAAAHEAPPATEDHAEEAAPIVVDERTAAAAARLRVSVGATEDEIRAALRTRLASSRLHPDHGGDGEEAKKLIAAKNLLIERAKAARS